VILAGLSLLDIAIFGVGVFMAAFVTGIAGFAFGLIAAAIWLHVLTPAQSAVLITAYAIIVQGYATWKLRQAIRWRRVLPLLIGGLIGIPPGLEVVRLMPATSIRVGIGVILICFSLYNLLKPKMPQLAGEHPIADGGVGVLSGILSGAAGLAGILPAIWSSLRAWPHDEQRAVFQPVGVLIFIATAAWFGGSGTIDMSSIRLFAIGLPALAFGTWLGFRLYGRLDEASFRKIVLIVLLISGLALVMPEVIR
jgi:uncharacterized membrane protein YfcA